ncbi:MAG TPA: DUF1592 domain-containing protein, partial [Kofleriaceae bacterium]|nr:DUF1592 domain-containing protein [Kofleriaceae bacterium]
MRTHTYSTSRRRIAPRRLALASLALALAACDGRITGPGEDGDGAGPDLSAQPRFARLTHAQWENTVRDLLRLPERTGLSSRFQPDPPLGRFDNNIARLTVTSQLWQGYQQAAEQIGERVATDAELLAALTADLPGDAAAAARAFVERFGRRAFRRPLDSAEVDRYAALFAEGPTHYPDHDPITAGVRFTIEAMLQSPYFLYRVELSTESEGGDVRLNGYEVASRLSYAFLDTMPDDDLFAAAEAGELDTEEGVRAHIMRLLDDPRAEAQFESFHTQAFKLSEYVDLDKDPDLFPQWSGALGEAMQEATARFLGEVALGGGSIRELLTSTTAFVNADLAAVYGLEGDFGDELVQVELDPGQRAGLLTRAGFLARNATLRDPDPIHRGVFININLLCREIAAVPNLPDDLMPVGETNRERIDSITGEGTCGEGCHATIINPIGFALENYDALGQWRTEDNGRPVDAADTYTFEDGRSISFMNG